jgi:hypothetical protein
MTTTRTRATTAIVRVSMVASLLRFASRFAGAWSANTVTPSVISHRDQAM